MTYRTVQHRPRWFRRWLLVLLTLCGSLAIASPAAAHLDLVSVTPADGSVMKNPSAAVTVVFTKAATPSGDGFTLLDADGQDVAVDINTPDGGLTWKIRPTTALEPATRYGLKWKVSAGDAHPKSGTVRFRVAGQSSSSDLSPTTGASGSAPAATDSSRTETADASRPQADSGSSAGGPGLTPAGEATALDAALAPQDQGRSPLGLIAALARWISIAGILIAVGALIVVITTLVGSEGDVRLAERVVRVAAALVVLGAAAEGICLLWTLGALPPWPPALAVVLRLLAGVAMAFTLRLVPHGTGGRRSHDVPALPDTPSRRGTGSHTTQLLLTPPVRTGRVRGLPARPIAAAAVSVMMLASFLFDGHTATVAPTLLIAAADLAHTAAAAVWVGGVVLLATLLLVRARAGVPTGAGELAVRFSVPATAAVVIAGIAGTALTLLIIDSPTELINTPWGRVLLIKLALVTAVAIMGYVNNRYALPALDAWRPGTARLLRRTVAAEATVMITVLLITAVLVASQT